jgi:hypothetical protein
VIQILCNIKSGYKNLVLWDYIYFVCNNQNHANIQFYKRKYFHLFSSRAFCLHYYYYYYYYNIQMILFFFSSCSHFGAQGTRETLVSLQFLNPKTVGRARGYSPSQGRYLHRTTQTQNKRRQPCLEWDFEPTIPMFERTKTILALDAFAETMNAVNPVNRCERPFK